MEILFHPGTLKTSLALAGPQRGHAVAKDKHRLDAGRKVFNDQQEYRAPLLIGVGEEQTLQLM